MNNKREMCGDQRYYSKISTHYIVHDFNVWPFNLCSYLLRALIKNDTELQ